MLTITHTAADGTMIDGTARGDGSNAILKACGWRWSRTISAWYLPRTRDVAAPKTVIDRTAQQLRAAGFRVEVSIDEARRATAEIEADQASRQVRRTEALTTKASRLATAAQAAHELADELAGRVPFGQPILAGHHSQGPMERLYDRIERRQRAAVDLSQAAQEAAAAADTASHHTGARYSPITVANRIRTLEADLRRTQRHQAAATTEDRRAQLADRHAQLTDQLAYWTEVRQEQLASGTAVDAGPHNVRPGDQVKIRGTWYSVIRANPKTVTVPSGYSWTNTAPYHEITEHRPATIEHQGRGADPETDTDS